MIKIRRLKCVLCPYKKVCLPEMEDGLTMLDNLEKENERITREIGDVYKRLDNLIDRYNKLK